MLIFRTEDPELFKFKDERTFSLNLIVLNMNKMLKIVTVAS